MGQFVNPGNDIFYDDIHSKIYVDKTGVISITNDVVNTSDRFICNSRPRRFGKSYTADMLTAYYSKGCDSKNLFEGFEISRDPDFEKYLILQIKVRSNMSHQSPQERRHPQTIRPKM